MAGAKRLTQQIHSVSNGPFANDQTDQRGAHEHGFPTVRLAAWLSRGEVLSTEDAEGRAVFVAETQASTQG